jgi:molybdenum cofactor cytidylyltransferase
MTLAVLPAAGASRRMGRPKLLLPFRDGTIVSALAASLRAAGVDPIVLVTAPGDEELRNWAREAGLAVAINPDPERGMLSSIREGIKALTPAQRGEILLVSPADLPNLRAESILHLLRRMEEARAPLAHPTYHGRRGHPLAIAPELIPEIETLDPAVGLRQLRDRHAGSVLEVEVEDAGVVQDVDTVEDYRALTPSPSPVPTQSPLAGRGEPVSSTHESSSPSPGEGDREGSGEGAGG